MPEGYTGADVYRRMNAFPQNAALLEEAHQAATKLQAAHTELADRVAKVQGKMDTRWSGDASAKAQAGLNPLLQTSHQAADDLARSAQSMSGQNGAFHDTKAKLVPLETTRPSTDDLASYSPFGASDSEKSAAQWDTDDTTNKQAYGTYYASTDSNRNAAAKEYPVLNAAPAGIAVGTAPAPPPVTGFDTGSGTSGRKGTGASSGRHASAPSGASAPGPSSPDSVAAPGSHDATQPGGRPSDSTTTSGYTPPKPPVSTAPGFGTGLLPTFGPVGTGGDSSVTGGIGGALGSSGGPGGGSGRGSLAGGAPGSGTGQPLGGGRGSGVGMPGETGTARPGGIGSSAGAAGAKGAPGMGGMGAGGGKSKGAEDEEHQRKVTLPDQDADDLFGGTPDGMKPVPPTIGA